MPEYESLSVGTLTRNGCEQGSCASPLFFLMVRATSDPHPSALLGDVERGSGRPQSPDAPWQAAGCRRRIGRILVRKFCNLSQRICTERARVQRRPGCGSPAFAKNGVGQDWPIGSLAKLLPLWDLHSMATHWRRAALVSHATFRPILITSSSRAFPVFVLIIIPKPPPLGPSCSCSLAPSPPATSTCGFVATLSTMRSG